MPPDYRADLQYPRLSFLRSLCPRTEFFTVEDLPTRNAEYKSANVTAIIERRFQQAVLNYTLWELDQPLLRLCQVDAINQISNS